MNLQLTKNKFDDWLIVSFLVAFTLIFRLLTLLLALRIAGGLFVILADGLRLGEACCEDERRNHENQQDNEGSRHGAGDRRLEEIHAEDKHYA